MVRYLSPEWIDRLGLSQPGVERSRATGVVLRQVVVGTPEGTDVAYDVVVSEGRSSLHRAAGGVADVTFTADYATAASIASGQLSTNAALAAGLLKVTGDVTGLGGLAGRVGGIDAMPAEVRAATEWV